MSILNKFIGVRKKQAQQPGADKARPKAGIFVSYPCSGRTWIRVILDELGVTLKYSHDQTSPRPGKLQPSLPEAYCKSDDYQKHRVIFLSRDPRDTAVSAFFHTTLRRGSFTGEIGDFIRDPLHGIEKIISFNLAWLARGPDLPAFMPITYEELSADPKITVHRIIDFLGVSLTDQAIATAVDNNTFDKMQEREKADAYREQYGTSLSGHDPSQPDSLKTRRGKTRGYIDYLSGADIKYCNSLLDRRCYFKILRTATAGER